MHFCPSLPLLLRRTAARTAFFCCCLALLEHAGYAQDKTGPGKKPAPPKDTLTLTSGEQLIGKLVKEASGNVIFQSDALGAVTIPIAKVKTLHASPFAVVAKGEKMKPRIAQETIPAGAVTIENNQVTLTPAASTASSTAALDHAPVASAPAAASTIPVKELVTIADTKSLYGELKKEHSLLYGWTGSVTLGTTIVNATDSAQTYTGAITAVRTIPVVPWTTPISRTTFNASGTYGLAKDPEIDSGGVIVQAPSVTKTDILHGDAEYDHYLSPRFFWLVNASADHNFGNGLQLQQAYGGGVGWTVLQKPNDTVSLKVGLQYLEQQFYDGIYSSLGTPDQNLVGLAMTETWSRNFAHNLKFSENMTLTPTFNYVQGYSGVVNATLAVPVYKKINVSLNSTDNYLGDPAQGYRRNSFQFTAGVTYVVK